MQDHLVLSVGQRYVVCKYGRVCTALGLVQRWYRGVGVRVGLAPDKALICQESLPVIDHLGTACVDAERKVTCYGLFDRYRNRRGVAFALPIGDRQGRCIVPRRCVRVNRRYRRGQFRTVPKVPRIARYRYIIRGATAVKAHRQGRGALGYISIDNGSWTAVRRSRNCYLYRCRIC